MEAMKENPKLDLQLKFERVVWFRYVDDAGGLPPNLPKLPRIPDPTRPQIVNVCPLVQIEPSEWIYRYKGSHRPRVNGEAAPTNGTVRKPYSNCYRRFRANRQFGVISRADINSHFLSACAW